jgi:serine/threonine protein kinase
MMRFMREAQAIASLRHPNIVQVHDFHTSTEAGGTTAYMVMNYVEGQTLAEYITSTSRMGKFPPATDLVHLFAAISSAIDYAHRRGMVHRDIKPSNILLERRLSSSRYPMGAPKLIDFGIVKLLGSSSNTLSGLLLGTPNYISPEQARGDPGNERSDIYSLGVILYELCTGVRPFQGDSPVAIMMQHINALPTPPTLINPNIPTALAEVILCCLAKEPSARFSSASAMTNAMVEAFNLPASTNLYPSIDTGERGVEATFGSPSQVEPGAVHDVLPPASRASPASETVYSQGVPLHAGDGSFPLAGSHNAPAITPGNTPVGDSSAQQPGAGIAALAPLQEPAAAPTFPPVQAPIRMPKQKSAILLALVLMFVVLVGASAGIFYFVSHAHQNTQISANQLAGHAYFESSGLVGGGSGQGIEDQLHLVLKGISGPAAGKSYYLWLLGDMNGGSGVAPRLLGSFEVSQGNVDVRFPYDQQHTNLLERYSQLLITEENANSTPAAPSTDRHTWRFSAQFPQTPSQDVDHLSALDYMRQLLVADPNLQGLHIGLAIQFLRNTRTVLALARSALENWTNKNASSLREQVISILDYLDGQQSYLSDTPGAHLLVDQKLIYYPLIDRTTTTSPGSYFKTIQENLRHIELEPDITQEMTNLATQVNSSLASVQNILQGQVLINAQKLFKMNDVQLLQAPTKNILTDLINEAGDAYNGQVDPSTKQIQGRVVWIVDEILLLATFDVKQFSS